jgi:hypothetical protein
LSAPTRPGRSGFEKEEHAEVKSKGHRARSRVRIAPSPAGDNPGDEPNPGTSQAFDALEITAPQTTIVQRRRATAKTIRLRDKEHCRLVATQRCVVRGRAPAEAHHCRFAQPGRWAARSATGTWSQSAASIIANSMPTAMKPYGGPGSASIPCRSDSNFGGNRD